MTRNKAQYQTLTHPYICCCDSYKNKLKCFCSLKRNAGCLETSCHSWHSSTHDNWWSLACISAIMRLRAADRDSAANGRRYGRAVPLLTTATESISPADARRSAARATASGLAAWQSSAESCIQLLASPRVLRINDAGLHPT